MKKPFLFVLPALLGLSLFGACGGSTVADEANCAAYCEDPKANAGNESLCKDYCTDRSATSDGKTESCTDFCASQVKCNSDVTQSACEDNCNDVDSVSRGGQEVLTKCQAEASCDSTDLLGLLDCVDDGLADLPLSETAKKFCEESQPKLNELCDQPATKDCEENIALLSDEFLSDLSDCAEKSDCQTARTCATGAVLSTTPIAVLQNPAIAALLGPILSGGGVNPNPGGGQGGAAP